jgi:hypothetical protein
MVIQHGASHIYRRNWRRQCRLAKTCDRLLRAELGFRARGNRSIKPQHVSLQRLASNGRSSIRSSLKSILSGANAYLKATYWPVTVFRPAAMLAQ